VQIVVLALTIALLGPPLGPPVAGRLTGGPMPLTLSSSAFTEGATIPSRFTCDGENVPPPLQWSGKPASGQSLVLIMDDPDAPGGVFTHWVAYDLPAGQADSGPISAGSGREGKNDFRKTGYGGPCPPRGHGAHRYFFTLSALDIASLGLPAGVTREQVETKMRGHVVATARLMGKYERK